MTTLRLLGETGAIRHLGRRTRQARRIGTSSQSLREAPRACARAFTGLFKVIPNWRAPAGAPIFPPAMTILRLFEDRGAITSLSGIRRQAELSAPLKPGNDRLESSRRVLGKGARPCRAEFDRRTQRTVIAPMTFIGAEALPDSAPVADEHFLLNPWHYHALSRARFMRTGLREVRPLRVDDELRHSSSVEVAAVFWYD